MAVSASEGPMGVPRHMPCLGMNGSILAFICGSDNLEFIELYLKNPEQQEAPISI